MSPTLTGTVFQRFASGLFVFRLSCLQVGDLGVHKAGHQGDLPRSDRTLGDLDLVGDRIGVDDLGMDGRRHEARPAESQPRNDDDRQRTGGRRPRVTTAMVDQVGQGGSPSPHRWGNCDSGDCGFQSLVQLGLGSGRRRITSQKPLLDPPRQEWAARSHVKAHGSASACGACDRIRCKNGSQAITLHDGRESLTGASQLGPISLRSVKGACLVPCPLNR